MNWILIISLIMSMWGYIINRNDLTILEKINNACKNEHNNSEACVAKKFYELTVENDMEVAMVTLKNLQKINPESKKCHVIAHYIAYAESRKNKTAWKKILTRVDSGTCSGGFVHGAIEGRFIDTGKNISTGDDVNEICGELKVDLVSRGGEENCAHIIGHLILAEKNGDIASAVEICADANVSLHDECFAGLFMESETRENLILHKNKEPLLWDEQNISRQENICEAYKGKSGAACWREIAHMYVDYYKNDLSKIYHACKNSGNDELTEVCYTHAVLLAIPVTSEKNLIEICKPFINSNERYERCYRNTVFNLFKSSSQPRLESAIEFCNSNQKMKKKCFMYFKWAAQNMFGEPATESVCENVNERYFDDCIRQFF